MIESNKEPEFIRESLSDPSTPLLLAFDSVYFIGPLRFAYTRKIKKLGSALRSERRLILYRLDKKNLFLRNIRSVSGLSTNKHKDYIDAQSIKFYKYLKETKVYDSLTIKGVPLFDIYTRQIKLKLAGVLIGVHRLIKVSEESSEVLEVVADQQTISMMQLAFSFLEIDPQNIKWVESKVLSYYVTLNSFVMRFAAIAKMLVAKSTLSDVCFESSVGKDAPTILITMPKRRAIDFFSTYVTKLDQQFNIILYCPGVFSDAPRTFRTFQIRRRRGVLRGLWRLHNLCFTASSYVVDTILIYKDHANLNLGIDVVNALFTRDIDAHISRLQTTIVDNYCARKAREKGIFILGHIFEEIYICDAALISTESVCTDSVKMLLRKNAPIAFEGKNSLITQRLNNTDSTNFDQHYLHNLLGIDLDTKIIFYASDPSKDESQRYLTEKFLMESIREKLDYQLVIKNHPQDSARITHYAYLDSCRPKNVSLIVDYSQRQKADRGDFHSFKAFEFNAAILSSTAFLTFSSSSVLQAIVLNVRSGIVDLFANGYYDYLVDRKATSLVYDKSSFDEFLCQHNGNVPKDVLAYCGLNNSEGEFDVGRYLLDCMKQNNRLSAAGN